MAGGLGDAPVHRVHLAGPARRRPVGPDQPHPRIGVHVLLHDLRGPVGRIVVDDHDLQVGVPLGAQRGQAAVDGGLLVTRRDHHDAR